MTKTLDRRLASILAGTYRPDDFILADAKDADMARGLGSAGPQRPGPDGRPRSGFRPRPDFLEDMAQTTAQAEIDILLASASNGEVLGDRGLFQGSPVTLAIRANDATDVWLARGASYSREPSRPFRSANLELVRRFCDLGLYSITFNNELAQDLASLEAYARFREEARRVGFRHFLEVFNPNAPAGLAPQAVPAFVNDSIHRTLAGLTRAERPLFLKIAYNGPRALEELVTDDPGRVVGRAGRLGGDDPGLLRALGAGGPARRPGGALRPQDPAGGVVARPGGAHAAGGARRALAGRGGARLPRGAREEGAPAGAGARRRLRDPRSRAARGDPASSLQPVLALPPDLLHLAAAFAAAFLAAAVNSVAGGGTLISFPVLIWLGLPSVVANATSTVGIWPGSLGSIWGFRRELSRTDRRMRMLVIPCLVGGAAGALLLRATTTATFDALVPFLVLFATVLFALRGTLQAWLRRRASGEGGGREGGLGLVHGEGAENGAPRWPGAGILAALAVAVYGGYFGAGMSIMNLSMLGILGMTDLLEMNALTSLFSLCVNGVAIALFAAAGLVDWPVALAMALGALLGGYGAAGIARRIGRKTLGRFVIIVGFTVSAIFFARRF